MTKKEALEKPSDEFLFGQILQGGEYFQDSKDWRRCKYTCHVDWVTTLLESGYIVQSEKNLAWPEGELPDGETNHYVYKFKATEKGIRWWLGEKAQKTTESDYQKLVNPEFNWAKPDLYGKPIGAEIRYRFYFGEANIAARGVLDGYFEFVDYYFYPRASSDASITVRLTEKGMRFFDSLPRLRLECA